MFDPWSQGKIIHWRGHQTSPTVVSLKGRLPQIMQSKPSFLAPLAEGQRAIVMALCPSCVRRPFLRASVNSSFKKLLLRNYLLDFYEISQECSLSGPLSNSFK